ncbi:uncharacterized protein LOC8070436 [Sorghum bicolor]|uniref:uncharacterized protein LOC8070436 n=1 Tax=Sorghum bicolor TaxID=4558 RepID=UPI000B4267EF|nr:uncharacterized protein LOC8070436 [Sorghum bicolor]|eukprot:XP_021311773.1 uncharacterized protein LOC8070436 [Sorghum bicolor]
MDGSHGDCFTGGHYADEEVFGVHDAAMQDAPQDPPLTNDGAGSSSFLNPRLASLDINYGSDWTPMGLGSWDPARLRVFIDVYHAQIKNGNFNKGVMSVAGWRDIKHRYFLATGLVHEKDQFTSKLQDLKAEWRICKALRKASGLGGSGNTIEADDAWWEREMKGKKALMKIRDQGMPDYIGQLDDIFEGWTVDGSTAYRPGTGAETGAIPLDDSDDEAQHDGQQDVPAPESQGYGTPGSQGYGTPGSQGRKRPSSSSPSVSSPSKKTKSSTARSWETHQREANDIERQKVNLFGSILEMQHKRNERHQHKRVSLTKEEKVEKAYDIALGMGISTHTKTSFLAMRKICHSEVELAIFLSCKDDEARWIIINENLPVDD